MQNAKEREQSRKLAFGLCRATHALDESQMQRSERRAESSLSGYAERRMLSTNVKCKGVSAERRVSLERYAERRMLSTNVKCKGASAEPKARFRAAHLGKRCKVTALEMRTERKIRRVKVW